MRFSGERGISGDPMPSPSTLLFTSLALTAFAANSILCRLALADHSIDAASFTTIRLVSGAVALLLIMAFRDRGKARPHFRLLTAFALFAYAAPFSFAYISIPAGAGALILFGAVQATMIGWDLVQGYRLSMREWCGLLLALGGLVVLTWPGAVDPIGAALMSLAGVAWGLYSVYGRGTEYPLRATAGNFAVAALLTIPFEGVFLDGVTLTASGITLAVLSGAVTSGIGYALWYTALRGLTATRAGIVQLLVPVLAATGGVVFLSEVITVRLVAAAAMILPGVTLAFTGRKRLPEPSR